VQERDRDRGEDQHLLAALDLSQQLVGEQRAAHFHHLAQVPPTERSASAGHAGGPPELIGARSDAGNQPGDRGDAGDHSGSAPGLA
jgi:hypothetical protein